MIHFAILLIAVLSPTAFAQTIAMIQYDADSHYGDYATNMENLELLATQAVDAGATVILLPEGSAYGYSGPNRTWCRPGMARFQGKTCDDVSTVAEPVPGGKTGNFWQRFADRHDVLVLFHIMERAGSAYYNTTVAVDGDGVRGSYRKRYLYYIDEAYASPGRDLLILTIEGRRFGVMICMDANYGSLFSEYKARGVDNIFLPMDWDQSPQGSRAGRIFFRNQAQRFGINIFASDQSAWDSTGYYAMDGAQRIRAPLADIAVGSDGFSLYTVNE